MAIENEVAELRSLLHQILRNALESAAVCDAGEKRSRHIVTVLRQDFEHIVRDAAKALTLIKREPAQTNCPGCPFHPPRGR